MEDNKQTQSNSGEPTGEVMDVQPPRPSRGTYGSTTFSAGTEQKPSVAMAEGQVNRETHAQTTESSGAAAAESKPDVPSEDPSDKPNQGLSAELLAQAENETKKPAKDSHELLAAHASRKNRGQLLAIIIAVVIALALSGIAVYAYLQSREEIDQPSQDANTVQQESESSTQPATSKEVEDTAKELDETINATEESQEIPDSGLSESSVGL